MKKSLKCAVFSVLMVCCIVFSLPLTALGAESYQMNINEPAKGDNQGYILLLVQGPSGTKQVQCISWTLLGNFDSDSTSQSTEMDITVSNSSSTISFLGYGGGYSRISCGFGRSLSGDSARTTYWSRSDSQVILYDYDLGYNTVLGYQIYGNGFLISHDLGNNNNTAFNVTWGDDANAVSLMTEMLAQLYIDAANDETMIGQLNELLAHAQTAEELLDNISEEVYLSRNTLYWIRVRLDEIRDILTASGESTFEEPSTDNINDYNDAEGELVSGAEDTSDIEGEIGKFEIDINASNSIWDIINQFLNAHPKVFGLAIGILCLGIIALILNR